MGDGTASGEVRRAQRPALKASAPQTDQSAAARRARRRRMPSQQSEVVPKISAIVCTYNRYDLLPRALASLATQKLPPTEFEIVVVDNSPDQDLSMAFANEFGDIP